MASTGEAPDPGQDHNHTAIVPATVLTFVIAAVIGLAIAFSPVSLPVLLNRFRDTAAHHNCGPDASPRRSVRPLRRHGHRSAGRYRNASNFARCHPARANARTHSPLADGDPL